MFRTVEQKFCLRKILTYLPSNKIRNHLSPIRFYFSSCVMR